MFPSPETNDFVASQLMPTLPGIDVPLMFLRKKTAFLDLPSPTQLSKKMNYFLNLNFTG
jgi:hypothetical protein